jgi:antitoxin FitA
MAMTHVRGVSDEAVTVLKVRAARVGRSLQQYVRQLLEDEAATPTAEEAAAQARSIVSLGAVTAADVLDVVAEMRAARA